MKELNLDVDDRQYLLKLGREEMRVFRNGEEMRDYVPNALTVALVRELFEAREEVETLKKALSENNLIGDTYD